MQSANQVIPDETINLDSKSSKKIKKMKYLEFMVERAKLKFKLKKERVPLTPADSSDAVIIVNVCFAYFSKLFKLMKKRE